jgi:hypothetical protein
MFCAARSRRRAKFFAYVLFIPFTFTAFEHVNYADATFRPAAISITDLPDRTLHSDCTSIGPPSSAHPSPVRALPFARHCTRHFRLPVQPLPTLPPIPSDTVNTVHHLMQLSPTTPNRSPHRHTLTHPHRLHMSPAHTRPPLPLARLLTTGTKSWYKSRSRSKLCSFAMAWAEVQRQDMEWM